MEALDSPALSRYIELPYPYGIMHDLMITVNYYL